MFLFQISNEIPKYLIDAAKNMVYVPTFADISNVLSKMIAFMLLNLMIINKKTRARVIVNALNSSGACSDVYAYYL